MIDDDLIDQLRKAAGIWFKNTDLLLLEDLIKRYRRLRGALADIAVSEDMTLETARRKAKRIYDEIALKEPAT